MSETIPAQEPPSPDGHSARRDYLFALLVLGCVFALLTAMTWRKWPDMLLDFGLQLYIPWKISTGAVLYRDLAYMTGGPLSQYFDAFLFAPSAFHSLRWPRPTWPSWRCCWRWSIAVFIKPPIN